MARLSVQHSHSIRTYIIVYTYYTYKYINIVVQYKCARNSSWKIPVYRQKQPIPPIHPPQHSSRHHHSHKAATTRTSSIAHRPQKKTSVRPMAAYVTFGWSFNKLMHTIAPQRIRRQRGDVDHDNDHDRDDDNEDNDINDQQQQQQQQVQQPSFAPSVQVAAVTATQQTQQLLGQWLHSTTTTTTTKHQQQRNNWSWWFRWRRWQSGSWMPLSLLTHLNDYRRNIQQPQQQQQLFAGLRSPLCAQLWDAWNSIDWPELVGQLRSAGMLLIVGVWVKIAVTLNRRGFC